MSLEIALASSKDHSRNLKNFKSILTQVQKQNLANSRHLLEGIRIYHQQKVCTSLNGNEVWRAGSSKLYEYSKVGKPILFIPSMINKPNILDLSEKHSLMLRLTKLGARPYLLDWGSPTNSEKNFTLDDYANRLITCLRFLWRSQGKISLAGYCMGGQLAMAAGCIAPQLIDKITFIATPWDFEFLNIIPKAVFKTLQNIRAMTSPSNSTASSLDVIPGELLQMFFYCAEPLTVNKKFINLSRGQLDKEEFAMIENWANDSVPIATNVFSQLVTDFIINNTPIRKQWTIRNNTITPDALAAPVLCVVAQNDRIAPKKSCMPLHHGAKNSTLLEMGSGHIGMVINDRYDLAKSIYLFDAGLR